MLTPSTTHSCGASLSLLDGITDIYTTYTYYNAGLLGQAYALLAMLLSNITVQLLFVVFAQNSKKGWTVKVKEALITIFFLRHAVDAYRVSTAHQDKDALMNPLTAMIVTKCTELATESIPGGVLQTFVYL